MRSRRNFTRKSTGRVEQLEEKLDGLYSLLQGATRATSRESGGRELRFPSFRDANRSATSTDSHSPGLGGPDPSALNTTSPSGHTNGTSTSSPEAFLTCPKIQSQPRLEPTREEAELYLSKFRTVFIPVLPFIRIPVAMTARQLQQERPITWWSIMSVASTSFPQQVVLSRKVRELLGYEVLVEGSRSMDLLLGILVFATWDRTYSMDKPILISLVQLAIAVLYDLGLHQGSGEDPSVSVVSAMKGSQELLQSPEMDLLEVYRAVLGCFILSTVPSHGRKGPGLLWTPQCDHCLAAVSTQENASDKLLAHLVKLRLLASKLDNISWGKNSSADQHVTIPGMAYLGSLQNQLHMLKSEIPSELESSKPFLLEFHSVDMRIHELGLLPSPVLFSAESNGRFECLHTTLQAVNSWISVFNSISPAEYVGTSCCICAQLTNCSSMLWRLSTCKFPEWDVRLVRETIDVPSVLDTMETKFAQVSDAAGLRVEDWDYFGITASRFHSMKGIWDIMVSTTNDSYGSPCLEVLSDLPADFFGLP